MQLSLKIILSLAVILLATIIGKKIPSLGGLIAVMPLTGVIVMVWLGIENRGNQQLLIQYTRGALWGILPTILFYVTIMICFVKNVSFFSSVLISFGVWATAAIVHQLLLRQ